VTASVKSDSSALTGQAEPYRVMVVDDSAVIRGFLTRYLEAERAIKVVATAANGTMALRNLAQARPDVVVLDIEMPEMDGLTALPKILKAAPDVRVVMASTLTHKNAEVSLRCMRMGAADYVPKPASKQEVNTSLDFRHELVEKVKVYAAARRQALGLPQPGGRLPASARPAAPSQAEGRGNFERYGRDASTQTSSKVQALSDRGRNIILRAPSKSRPDILAVAASTGGPQALIKFLSEASRLVKNVPVLVVQHMPATFTAILANHLSRASGLNCIEAEDGTRPLPGNVYIAPGGFHMTVRRGGTGTELALDQNEPENFCRPAVDPLFRSLAEAYGSRTLAVVLTGMGHDGLRGARTLVQAGATLIAQDEASSVVWGMPGAVATAGLCAAVAPLSEMPHTVERFLGAGR